MTTHPHRSTRRHTTSAARLVDSATRIMVHDANGDGIDKGTVGELFAASGVHLQSSWLGEPQGEDEQRAAYNWWPLLDGPNGRTVGEVRDDANGITVHLPAEEWARVNG